MAVDRCSTPPTPGHRLGSGFARRSSPASNLKIPPDSSLPGEGPAEAGTDCWAAAILAVTRSATSSLSYSAGADRHQPGDFRRVQSPYLRGADVYCPIRCWGSAPFFSRAGLGGQEFRLGGGGESLPNASEAAVQPFAA